MKEIYQWTEWFSELAQKVKEGGKDYLHHKVFNEINWGDNTAIKNYKVTDPFSFFSFLAFKSGNKDRDTVCSSVHELFSITAELPDTEDDNSFIFPKNISGQRTIFTDGALVDKDFEELKRQAGLFWKLFNQAVDEKLEAEDFSSVLNAKGVGVSNLTQTLFLINPKAFCPIDKTGPLAIADHCGLPNFKGTKKEGIKREGVEKQIKNNGLDAYLEILEQIKAKFVGCELYEINTLAHFICRSLEGKDNGIEVKNNYWQVSTNAENYGAGDFWDEFSENYHVRAYRENEYPTREVEAGDVILVRTGAEKAKAIGIAYGEARNDSEFSDDWNIIDILWVTKEEKEIENISVTAGFTHADGIAKNFETAYPDTFKILKNLANENTDQTEYSVEESEMSKYENETIYEGELNQIYYGPPGTGKTYNTIAKAVEIVDPDFSANNRTELKARFNTLKEQGQIAFVTFHQSFSYEDFIEGIKPQDDNGQISYKVKDGIFKQICEDALENYDNYEDSKLDPQTFTKKLEIEDILEKFADYIEEEKVNEETHCLPTPNSDSEDSGVTLDKILKNKSGNFQSFDLGGSVVSQRLTKDIFLRDLQNYLDKKITTYKEIKPTFKSKRKYHGNARYYWGAFKLIEKALTEKAINSEKIYLSEKPPDTQKLKNFVLIIDEINRGNISKIFGELITLLETDKRIGNPEALTLKLPYSASFGDDDVEEFGVPNNLYIIGTMNTADRSLSLLDTALRRRFRFIEKMPDYELLEGIKIAGIEIGEMLKSINERIIAQYDREHQIGHSFFLTLDEDSTIEDLSEIFAYKILPLLEEYFYDDRAKISQVLNNNGFYKEENGSWELDQDVLEEPASYKEIYKNQDGV